MEDNMPFEVVLPRLGWNMETGRLGEWLKRDGERVEAGELLFTVEGDKATQEVEALDSGILRIPPDSPPPGKEVPVGTLLGYLVAEGEPMPWTQASASVTDQRINELASVAAGSTVGQQPDQYTIPQGRFAVRNTQYAPAISPRSRRIAGELGADWTGLTGSGRTGRIVERDVRRAAAAAQAAPVAVERISPLARRLAAELGVDADALAARLPGGRIERADIEAEAERLQVERLKVSAPAAPAMPLAPTVPSAPPALGGTAIPITTVRRTIADRMATSAHTVAPVTLTTEADATELVRLRKQLKDDGTQPVPSYNDLLAKLCGQALLEHPMVNARFDGETIVQAATANIGVAVDTDRGLLVPVLRDVQTKTLRQVARESVELIEKARTGRITVQELQGGTFTITNLGMYEIDAFTPIINLPECAILGVGRIVPKQIVVDAEAERVAIRHMMFLSLTFDHRLVDGAPAARFLQRVKQYVEKPYLWLAG
jgi:pyruvate dehydrogenase E2 component (dihydrolipoamide acetyltransferase)